MAFRTMLAGLAVTTLRYFFAVYELGAIATQLVQS